ncbi:hypothetical protein EYZ11_005737 [Aspergillus tanneri]|uniref:catechol O-methyltransferase n=1 Tax=Aspergillus tanneri TaxID=1220188 RepID=A0A4S3JN71_9EURO|nr:uncharacterized protein ATNIH1004_004215 [Aspergillus tanneri]KAA8648330.1 hypothetical protein ATNIH1004_004215 [Aspergillus tanneri]THC94791.1 hypothetical protein EYZ11_005737 [Aspergillus tanneri]
MSGKEAFEALAQALHKHIFSQPREKFADKPWAITEAIDEFATINRMMTYREGKMRLSKQLLERMQAAPKTLLEFGTYVGSSAIGWGAMLRDLHGEDSHVYTFELSATIAQIARDFIQLAGLEEIVHVVEGSSSDSLRRLYTEGKLTPGGVDVVFFDHWEEFYVPDLKICEELRLLRKGSLAIADNTDYPGAPEYIKYVQSGGQQKGAVQYETESFEAEVPKPFPSIVMVSTVVDIE